jgi:F0F1-type ATP synthase delta subunit
MAKISTRNIVQTIYELTRGKTGKELEAVLVRIRNFLVEKRLINRSPEILRKLKEILNKEEGIVEVKLTVRKIPSVEKLNKIESVLKKRYAAKQVVATIGEDETVLGGMRIEAKDEVIDLTYKNKLNQLQDYLIRN